MLVNSFLNGIKKGFQLFGSTITETITIILLFVTYIIGVGIIALPAKLTKKEFLPFMKADSSNQSQDKLSDKVVEKNKVQTYWIIRKESSKEDFERMF